MNKEIKIIGLDLDGTVFTNKKTITDRTKEVIREAIKKGVIVMPATGRPVSGLPEEFLAIEGVRYALTSNGALVLDFKKNQPIFQCNLETDMALELIHKALSFDATVDVYYKGQGYTAKDRMEHLERYVKDPIMREFNQKTKKPVEDLEAFVKEGHLSVEKINMYFARVEERQEAFRLFRSYGELLVTDSLPLNLEINHRDANKGNGLVKFGEAMGVSKEQIMACGDSENDRAMMMEVGFSVAMGNAKEEIKQLADYVTRTNEEDGVAYAIEKFVL